MNDYRNQAGPRAIDESNDLKEQQIKEKDVLKEILLRPSLASKREAIKYRARFDADRKTQMLDQETQSLFVKLISDIKSIPTFEHSRVSIGRSALRSMGLVNHSIPSYHWFLHKELTKLIP